jgi:hypothetical protein
MRCTPGVCIEPKPTSRIKWTRHDADKLGPGNFVRISVASRRVPPNTDRAEHGFPVTVAGNPSTSPVSDMRTISVRTSIEVVESFTRPAHRTKTPRGACASTNSVAPLG